MAPLRLGLAGCGRIVQEGHCAAYERHAGKLAVRAVADPEPERRSAVGARLGVEPVSRYADAEAMIGRETLDAVVVATPPAHHRRAIVAALDAGCSVLSEKPLGLDLGEVAVIEQAAARSRGVVAVVHNYLYQPGWQDLVKRVRGGEIGRPVLLRLAELSGGHWDETVGRAGSWRGDPRTGGGPLRDNLYHAVYLAEALLASPVHGGQAQQSRLLKGYPACDTAAVNLSHESGGLTVALVSWCYSGRPMALAEVAGEAGVLRYRYWEAPDTLELERRGRIRQLAVQRWYRGDAAGFGAAIGMWLEALLNHRAPPQGLAAGRRVLEILAMLEASAAVVNEPGV